MRVSIENMVGYEVRRVSRVKPGYGGLRYGQSGGIGLGEEVQVSPG
jgi:hypothetical protein